MKLNENIILPIKVGDTILTGRFKNKRTTVKSIGKDEYGMPTINGRKVVNFRIMKESIEVEFPEDMPMDENSYLKNAQSRLKKVYKHLGVEYGQTRRGDKYVQINYIPKSVPQSQSPEFVKVFYDSDEELQKIGKTLKLKLKESINEQRPIPMDTPNEFVYMDFKKWVYKNRKKVKNMMLKQKGDSTKMFLLLSALWYKWARKNAPMFTFMKDDKKFGRALMVLMVDDDLIFDRDTFKKTNRITQVKEIAYDNKGDKCPGPVTLDGRCLHGRNTYQKEGEEINEIGIFKISQFTKGIIPAGRLDTHTPQKKKEAIKLIKNFHSMLNAFWRENDIPFRARLK